MRHFVSCNQISMRSPVTRNASTIPGTQLKETCNEIPSQDRARTQDTPSHSLEVKRRVVRICDEQTVGHSFGRCLQSSESGTYETVKARILASRSNTLKP